jgi:ureidoacrylate peracid hydrolase
MELLRTLEEKVDPGCAAVMVIDMQNDFCSEGGFLDHLDVDLGPIQAIVPTIRRLLDKARERGVPVLHAYYDGDPRFFLAPMLERLERKNESEAYCMPGSWGIEIVDELKPREGELVIGKHRYSAFFGTDLDMHLKANGIQTLILCGTATNNCVDGTGRDAFYNGYYVVLPSDASAAPTDELHRATLQTADHAYGIVSTVGEIIATWDSAPRGEREGVLASVNAG